MVQIKIPAVAELKLDSITPYGSDLERKLHILYGAVNLSDIVIINLYSMPAYNKNGVIDMINSVCDYALKRSKQIPSIVIHNSPDIDITQDDVSKMCNEKIQKYVDASYKSGELPLFVVKTPNARLKIYIRKGSSVYMKYSRGVCDGSSSKITFEDKYFSKYRDIIKVVDSINAAFYNPNEECEIIQYDADEVTSKYDNQLAYEGHDFYVDEPYNWKGYIASMDKLNKAYVAAWEDANYNKYGPEWVEKI